MVKAILRKMTVIGVCGSLLMVPACSADQGGADYRDDQSEIGFTTLVLWGAVAYFSVRVMRTIYMDKAKREEWSAILNRTAVENQTFTQTVFLVVGFLLRTFAATISDFIHAFLDPLVDAGKEYFCGARGLDCDENTGILQALGGYLVDELPTFLDDLIGRNACNIEQELERELDAEKAPGGNPAKITALQEELEAARVACDEAIAKDTTDGDDDSTTVLPPGELGVEGGCSQENMAAKAALFGSNAVAMCVSELNGNLLVFFGPDPATVAVDNANQRGNLVLVNVGSTVVDANDNSFSVRIDLEPDASLLYQGQSVDTVVVRPDMATYPVSLGLDLVNGDHVLQAFPWATGQTEPLGDIASLIAVTAP